MRTLLMIPLLMLAVPDRPDLTPKEKTKSVKEQLRGKWLCVNSQNGGKPYEVIKAGQSVFSFDGDLMTLHLKEGGMGYKYVLTLDETKHPATINIESGAVKGAAKPLPGIIKIEGEMLTICYQFGGGTVRPSEFVSPLNTPTMLWQMKRIKT